jgi:hypothetical protein
VEKVRRINVTHYDLRFEHEVFSYRRLSSATLSTREEPDGDQLVRGSSSAASLTTDGEETLRRVELVVGVVCDFLKQQSNHAVSRAITEGIIRYGRSVNLSPMSEEHSDVVRSVERLLKQATQGKMGGLAASSKVKEFDEPDGLPALRIFAPPKPLVHVHLGLTLIAEVAIGGAVIGYLVVFAVALFGVKGLRLLLP